VEGKGRGGKFAIPRRIADKSLRKKTTEQSSEDRNELLQLRHGKEGKGGLKKHMVGCFSDRSYGVGRGPSSWRPDTNFCRENDEVKGREKQVEKKVAGARALWQGIEGGKKGGREKFLGRSTSVRYLITH